MIARNETDIFLALVAIELVLAWILHLDVKALLFRRAMVKGVVAF